MATDKLKIGNKMPAFSLTGTDGNTYTESSFRGKDALVIIFSCNHCPYVQAYENRIISLQENYKESLQVIAINANDDKNYPEDSFGKMQERAKEKKFNFPYLRDDEQTTAELFGATHTPEIFLFDKERKLIFHGKIDDNWKDEIEVRENYLRNAIDEFLNGQKISVPETFTIGCTIKWKTN